jgi:hypothetical protein
VTPKVLKNVIAAIGDAADLDGYELLNDDDKARVDAAWAAGAVADEDVPESARKADAEGDDDGEDKPKKRKAPAKKAAAAAADGEDAPEKPKRAPRKKAVKVSERARLSGQT